MAEDEVLTLPNKDSAVKTTPLEFNRPYEFNNATAYIVALTDEVVTWKVWKRGRWLLGEHTTPRWYFEKYARPSS